MSVDTIEFVPLGRILSPNNAPSGKPDDDLGPVNQAPDIPAGTGPLQRTALERSRRAVANASRWWAAERKAAKKLAWNEKQIARRDPDDGSGFRYWSRFIERVIDLRDAHARAKAKRLKADRAAKNNRIDALFDKRADHADTAMDRRATHILAAIRLGVAVNRAKELSPAAIAERKRAAEKRRWLKARHRTDLKRPLDAATGRPIDFRIDDATRFKRDLSKRQLMKLADELAAFAERYEDGPNGELPEWRVELIARQQAYNEALARRRATPTRWHPEQVAAWLEDAFETLFRLPGNVRPSGFKGCMPDYLREFSDMIGQGSESVDDTADGAFARIKALGLPDTIDVERMHVALAWPVEHMQGWPDESRAAQYHAQWVVLGLHVETMCKRRHLPRASFYRDRDFALERIAARLNDRRS